MPDPMIGFAHNGLCNKDAARRLHNRIAVPRDACAFADTDRRQSLVARRQKELLTALMVIFVLALVMTPIGWGAELAGWLYFTATRADEDDPAGSQFTGLLSGRHWHFRFGLDTPLPGTQQS